MFRSSAGVKRLSNALNKLFVSPPPIQALLASPNSDVGLTPSTSAKKISTSPIFQSVCRGLWYRMPVTHKSHHRSRPPNPGPRLLTRCRVVDNSDIGKRAMTSGLLPKLIHVHRPLKLYRKRHMPNARLGDKAKACLGLEENVHLWNDDAELFPVTFGFNSAITIAIMGEIHWAYCVGMSFDIKMRRHGVPSYDSFNIVIVDKKGNPVGNRVLAPIPSCLKNIADPNFAKILALATKFI